MLRTVLNGFDNPARSVKTWVTPVKGWKSKDDGYMCHTKIQCPKHI